MAAAMKQWQSEGFEKDQSLDEVTCKALFELSKTLERELIAARQENLDMGKLDIVEHGT